jgi:hypothetical protein
MPLALLIVLNQWLSSASGGLFFITFVWKVMKKKHPVSPACPACPVKSRRAIYLG